MHPGGDGEVLVMPIQNLLASVTLVVSSIAEQRQRLAKLNIRGGERSSTGTVKTLMITDPDGNHIAFAEPIDSSLH
jgi:hypothetical protein